MTNRQKRILVSVATPLLAAIYAGFRVVTLEAFRQRTRDPKTILVVRLDTIGDVVLSEPAIRSLRTAFPSARLDLLVGAAGKAVLAGNLCIDRFIVYDAPWHAGWRGKRVSWPSEIMKAIKTAGGLRRNRYDMAIELRGDPRDIAFMSATGATVKVGNGWRGGGFMLNIDAKADVEAHRVDFALQIVGAAGASVKPSSPTLCLDESHRQAAASLLPDGDGEYIAMHLGAGFPSKCLPVQRFAEVASALTRNSNGEKRQIVVIGGKDDAGLAEKFHQLFSADTIDLVGRVNLLETAAILNRCALFIGNDSGPMHLAAAVGTPVVALFGPSEPQKYRPYMVRQELLELPLPCRPCDHIHCSQKENICMTGIDVVDIVTAAEGLMLVKETAGHRND